MLQAKAAEDKSQRPPKRPRTDTAEVPQLCVPCSLCNPNGLSPRRIFLAVSGVILLTVIDRPKNPNLLQTSQMQDALRCFKK